MFNVMVCYVWCCVSCHGCSVCAGPYGHYLQSVKEVGVNHKQVYIVLYCIKYIIYVIHVIHVI
jgi:hypothetical protein